MLCRVADVKNLPVYRLSADYIVWPFEIFVYILGIFENMTLLKPVLRGVASVAYFITGHEQTQSNRVYYFLVFGVVLASKRSGFSEAG